MCCKKWILQWKPICGIIELFRKPVNCFRIQQPFFWNRTLILLDKWDKSNWKTVLCSLLHFIESAWKIRQHWTRHEIGTLFFTHLYLFYIFWIAKVACYLVSRKLFLYNTLILKRLNCGHEMIETRVLKEVSESYGSYFKYSDDSADGDLCENISPQIWLNTFWIFVPIISTIRLFTPKFK